jgi:uncharacterized integral membrane protein
MIRTLRYILLALLALCLLTVAMANRDPVTVKLLPAGFAALVGADWQLQLPLFLVIFAGVAAGLLIGFFWEWARERKHRTAAKAGTRQVSRLERELAVLKDSSGVPAQDDVLALLDKPKAR